MTSACCGARPGFRREWWYYLDGEVIYCGDQAGAEQAMREHGGAGRVERRTVADDDNPA